MAAPATLALDSCPVCGNPGGEDFTLGGAGLRRCATCTAVYSQRYADPDAVYVDGYYSGESGFGIDIRHPRFQAFLADVNRARAEMLEHYVPAGRLLDVGCGAGDFMSAARERGWDVVGVDPIAESGEIARARGLDVRTTMLEESGLPERSFDVVSVFHVLEHVPDCRAFLRTIARWAKPGGHVLAESPNWESHVRKATGDRYVHLRPLEHLTHFAPRTLAAAFGGAGLQTVVIRTPTWASDLHSPTEALADTGRGSWARRLGPLARTAASAARAVDARRGQGMVVWGLARVP